MNLSVKKCLYKKISLCLSASKGIFLIRNRSIQKCCLHENGSRCPFSVFDISEVAMLFFLLQLGSFLGLTILLGRRNRSENILGGARF